MKKDQLLGTDDVAKRLNCSGPTVRRYADIGLLPVQWTETGRRIFTESGVQRFIASRAVAERNAGK